MLAIVVVKVQNKSKVLKATKEKGQFTYKGVKIRLSVDISTATIETRMQWNNSFKIPRENNNKLEL